MQCEDLRKQLLRDHWLKDALPSSVGADGREDKDRPLCAIFNFFKSEVTHFDKFIPFEDEEVPIYLETEDKIKTGVFLLSEAARKYLQEGIHEDDLKDIGGNEASATAFWKAKSAWQGICEEILQYSCPPKVIFNLFLDRSLILPGVWQNGMLQESSSTAYPPPNTWLRHHVCRVLRRSRTPVHHVWLQ